MTSKKKIQKEIWAIADVMDGKSITDKQYCEMYAARQALTWALDERSCAAPLRVILGNRIYPLPEIFKIEDNPAS